MSDPSQVVFRCTHFACLLTAAACIRRQVETKRHAGTNRQLSVHPHCSSGTCEQGNAHRSAFPTFVPTTTDPRQAPTFVHQETSMPCSHCKSPTMHKADCPNRPTKKGKSAMKKAAKEVVRAETKRLKSPFLVRSTLYDTQAATIEQLVETIVACRAELLDRRVLVASQLKTIEESLGNVDQPAARSA